MGAKDWLIGLTVLGGGILAAIYILPKLGLKFPEVKLPEFKIFPTWKPIDWTRFEELLAKGKEEAAAYAPSPELVEWRETTAWRRQPFAKAWIPPLTPERRIFIEAEKKRRLGIGKWKVY